MAARTPATAPSSRTEEQTLRQASAALGVPFVRLMSRSIPQSVLDLVPAEVARTHTMVPYEQTQLASGRRVIRLAVSNPAALEEEAPVAVNQLHTRDGYLIEVALAPAQDIQAILTRYQRKATAVPQKTQRATVRMPDPLPAKKLPLPAIDLSERIIPPAVLERIPEETARKYRAIVFEVAEDNKTIHMALERPTDPAVQDFLHFLREQASLVIKLYVTTPSSIDQALTGYQHKKLDELPRQLIDPGIHKPRADGSGAANDLFPQQSANFWDEAQRNPTLARPADQAPTQPSLPSASSPEPPIKPIEPLPAVNKLTTLRTEQPVAAVASSAVNRPDLLVPKEEVNLLIPVSADVERDLVAVVGQPVTTISDLEAVVRTGFIPKIVGAIVLLAAEMQASDIHIQADDTNLLVRFRVDGILADIINIPLTLQAPVISRIKILAKLKIDEQRIPQDGRFDVQIGSQQVDLRVSTFPTVRGEKVVIRLLDKSAGLLKLEQLGLMGSRLERLRAQIQKPYGVVLSTGPTGSGKSTTLYAVLQEIAGPAVNVVTLEDPVEYEIPGINQAQIKPKIGFGFAEGLRSVLRQDPNIIMVGEIRDLETASMMTHAALTGHLVLSTLHTNDAAGALPRLINMGVEPFLITSAMNGVVAQRLVRKLCPACRVPWTPSATVASDVTQKLSSTTPNNTELDAAVNGPATFYKPRGCSECHDGFKGRIGIFEVLVMSETIEELTVKKAPGSELAAAAINEGMITMEQDGLMKVVSGATTLEEVLRVTKADERPA